MRLIVNFAHIVSILGWTGQVAFDFRTRIRQQKSSRGPGTV